MYGDGVYEEKILLADFLTKLDFRLFNLGYVYDEEFNYVCHVSLGCTDEFPEFNLAEQIPLWETVPLKYATWDALYKRL
ncbi:hypothetical protein HZA99_01415 [Candidatus Woesearchaeota archaeon]|nr:hypothetical protein [Candidatus Woesearchaeota archaeon]